LEALFDNERTRETIRVREIHDGRLTGGDGEPVEWDRALTYLKRTFREFFQLFPAAFCRQRHDSVKAKDTLWVQSMESCPNDSLFVH